MRPNELTGHVQESAIFLHIFWPRFRGRVAQVKPLCSKGSPGFWHSVSQMCQKAVKSIRGFDTAPPCGGAVVGIADEPAPCLRTGHRSPRCGGAAAQISGAGQRPAPLIVSFPLAAPPPPPALPGSCRTVFTVRVAWCGLLLCKRRSAHALTNPIPHGAAEPGL